MPSKLPRARGYGLALVSVAAGLALRAAIGQVVGPGLPTYITFYPAVMVAALLGGLGPGLVATAVSALVVDYWILPPLGLFRYESLVDLVGVVLFSSMGAFMSVVAELYRRSRQTAVARARELVSLEAEKLRKIAEANERLEQRVVERTRALAQTEEQARARAAELQAVLDAAPVAVWIAHDPEARNITGNAYADELLRASRGGNISASANEAVVRYRVFRDGNEIEPQQLPAQVAAATGKPVPAQELRLLFPDGTTLDLVLGAVPLLDANGNVRGSVTAGTDVTALKQAQETVRRAEARLTQAVRVARLGIFEHDHLSDEIEYSPVMRGLLGFTNDEEVTISSTLEKVLIDDRETLAAAIRRAHDPAGHGLFDAEYRVATADGHIRWISARSQTFFEGEGAERRPMRTIGAVLDVTERKAAQAALERLVAERTAKLQELVGELEHFSYTITHDMRAPLRGMRGFAEIMAETCAGCQEEEPQAFLRRIAKSADRMDALITDALSYSKAVRQELVLAPVDAGALLRGILDSYPELQPSRTRVEIQGDIPLVMANEAGLTQCLSNLLGNAVKFVKTGQTPEIRIWAETPTKESVRIWIEDNGIGIPSAMLPRVFEMFSRGHQSYEGTGIGLALVRKVMDRMGGKVGVQSEEGKGSRFWLDFRPGIASEARQAK